MKEAGRLQLSVVESSRVDPSLAVPTGFDSLPEWQQLLALDCQRHYGQKSQVKSSSLAADNTGISALDNIF